MTNDDHEDNNNHTQLSKPIITLPPQAKTKITTDEDPSKKNPKTKTTMTIQAKKSNSSTIQEY